MQARQYDRNDRVHSTRLLGLARCSLLCKGEVGVNAETLTVGRPHERVHPLHACVPFGPLPLCLSVCAPGVRFFLN